MSFNTFANEPWFSEIPQTIEKLVRLDQSIKNSCNEKHTAQKFENSYQLCLEEVCGKTGEFTSISSKWDESFKTYSGRNFESGALHGKELEIYDLVKEYYAVDDEALNILDYKDDLLRLAKKPKENITFKDSELSKVLKLSEAFEAFRNVTTSSKVDESFYSNVDGSKLERYKSLGQRINIYLRDGSYIVRNTSSDAFIKVRYPDLSFEEGVKRYLQKAKAIEEMIKRYLEGFAALPTDTKATEVAFLNGSLERVELDIFIQSASVLELFGLAIQHAEKYSEEIEKELGQKLLDWTNKEGVDVLAAIDSSIKEVEESKAKEVEIKKTKLKADKNVCLDVYYRNINMLPSDAQIKKLKSVVEESKKEFISKINDSIDFSSESKMKIIENLKALNFKLPYSKSTFETSFIKSLKSSLQRHKSAYSKKLNAKVKDIFSFTLYSAAFPDALNEDEDEGDELEDGGEFQEDCTNFEQEPFSDATYTSLGEIMVSYTLAQSPEGAQKQIILHEMAHNLEHLLKDESITSLPTSAKFNKIRDCLNNYQELIVGKGSEAFFGENFADAIATKIEKGFSKPKACIYMKNNSENGEYISDHIKNKNEGAVHSSVISRVLKYYVDKNVELPKSCKNALTKNGVVSFEKQCELFNFQ